MGSPPPSARPDQGPRHQPLPRLVDPTRILAWFQCHLTLLNLVVAIIFGAVLSDRRGSSLDADDPVRQRLGRVEVLIPALIGTAILLAVAAALGPRDRWSAAA